MAASHVPEEGYLALLKELTQGPWAPLQIDPYLQVGSPSCFRADVEVRWKLRIHRGCNSLLDATRRPGRPVKEVDDEWDPLQRELNAELERAIAGRDAAKKKAAEILKRELTLGRGTAQTKLPPEQEVDFGRQQALKARKQFAQEISLLGLDSLIDDIEEKTEELNEAVGNTPAQGPQSSRFRALLIRRALKECRQALNAVLDESAWLLSAPDVKAEEKTRLEELRRPLLQLLERYPAPAPAKPAGEQGQETTEGSESSAGG